MILRALILGFALGSMALQEPKNPDDYVGPEDPAHEGQPKTCTNTPHRKAVKSDCKCVKTSCDPEKAMEDSKCYVFCRKPACHCDHGCETE
jgi:hypothetical protein